MTRTPCFAALLAFSSLALGAAPTQSCFQGPPITVATPTCGALDPPTLSCTTPSDVQGNLAQANANTVQRASNLFSWQQFIALNWPADPAHRGRPDADQPISGPGPRVWETWKETFEVYRPDGSKPAAWNTTQPTPAACGRTGKLLLRDTKVSDVVDAVAQALPATGSLPATLKDQSGRPVRYEIRLNQILFDYIVANGLYNGLEQARAASVQFPPGSQLIKAAWREVDSDSQGYFLSTDACVCEDDSDGQPVDCKVQTMGLAGLHLMTLTESAPQWIWSTFEQVDNLRSNHSSVRSLNNLDCSAEQCPPNKQTPDGVPTQLAREMPIPNQNPDCTKAHAAVDNVAGLNTEIRKALEDAKTPLTHYQLIDTQWPLPGHGSGTEFTVLPARLANTTMESFSQDTSSCMGCHAMSRTLNPDKYVSGDFSFTLNNARPRPPGAVCVDVEASESCDDSLLSPPQAPAEGSQLESWVYQGYLLTRRTYEMVNRPDGPRYVGNKLHCESCHLRAGGDPEAAWWAGVEARMGGLEGLQTRINQCFTHSMNGIALCEPGAQCDTHPEMRSLVAYMRWLTDQFEHKHPGATPTSGFPAIQAAPSPPDSARGQRVYTQKCAFCHNGKGEGRYEHGYFRPALWGADSFNASAGMTKVDTLAAFLRANMPFTSGGMLSVQEAWDLAQFIEAQPRPAGAGSVSSSQGDQKTKAGENRGQVSD